MWDVVVKGSGLDSFAAAIELQRTGRKVLVLEDETISPVTTLPGFIHDVGPAAHPLTAASPFFSSLGLERYGLKWIEPPYAVSHPLEDGEAAFLTRSVHSTAAQFIPNDYRAYQALLIHFEDHFQTLMGNLLGPFHVPHFRDWPQLARFAFLGFRSARNLIEDEFEDPRAVALLAGLAAHASVDLEHAPSMTVALVLAIIAHQVGWPIPEGGTRSISHALRAYFAELGGHIKVGDEIPEARKVIEFPEKVFSGAGVFEMDWALSGPIPWTAVESHLAGTIHLGGSYHDVLESEHALKMGRLARKPFIWVSQPSLFDHSRAPSGKHTAHAYFHVPPECRPDLQQVMEERIESFAPGFYRLILARHQSRHLSARKTTRSAASLLNPDLGVGTHGMNGYGIAHDALRSVGLR